ncbi:MarR family winged helix-turn-helix transcriptional regulator [Billgrantia bachuensis]|uniref:MarR family winged helix-turn-helix transcriptional regulator n=1 Tax=Billgrantia bachuensis TaxID=2717286 RepID=UPI001F106D0D|nr:MarR family winged helix-turn-helix transcriptional regulator [Halomonas bachuensis]
MNTEERQASLAREGDESLAEPPTKQELDLNQFLPYRLNSLADRISQALAELYEERYQLNIAQWRVLAWLSHCDELTAKKVCTYTNMDKARVSRAIQALEERGLIRRTPAPEDQRQQDLHLTAAGRALLAKLIPEAQAWEAELVATLTAGEYRDLLNVMRKLERQLERIG